MTDDPQQPAMHLSITPEPTPEEEGAIVATLGLLMSTRPAAPVTDAPDPANAWALAGRDAGHQTIPGRTPRWSRSRAWLLRTNRNHRAW